MNGLTTIASLPMGGGVAAALPAEVGKRGKATTSMTLTWLKGPEMQIYMAQLCTLGYTVNAQGVIERVKP